MHDQTLEANQLNRRVVEAPELLGKECVTCQRILAFKFFRRDSSSRDGFRDQCDICAAEPCLPMAEQVLRMREKNNSSEAVKRQRPDHQDEYKDDKARYGKAMYSSEFIHKIGKLLPCLKFVPGAVEDDIAVYQILGRPENGRMFKYLWYIPQGLLPEYSLYEFDEVRDIRLKEKQRGWRTPLLRLIKDGFLTEGICDAVFGPAVGPASAAWYRQLWIYRNQKQTA